MLVTKDVSLTTSNKILSDEVLRKIGRNVVIFQQIENMLKIILAHSQINGFASELESNIQARIVKFKGQTMGGLASQFVDEVLTDSAPQKKEPEKIEEPWFSFKFSIAAESNFYENQISNLEMVTKARNELIHHFLPMWQPDSPDVLNQACMYLDAQRTQSLPLHEQLRSFVQSMIDGSQKFAEFVAREGDKFSDIFWLQNSELVIFLRDLASKKSNLAGWIYLAGVGSMVKQKFPEDFENLELRYGYSNLKNILIACELFEIEDEAMSTGTVRTRYRLKSSAQN
jgi:hypothetical protein